MSKSRAQELAEKHFAAMAAQQTRRGISSQPKAAEPATATPSAPTELERLGKLPSPPTPEPVPVAAEGTLSMPEITTEPARLLSAELATNPVAAAAEPVSALVDERRYRFSTVESATSIDVKEFDMAQSDLRELLTTPLDGGKDGTALIPALFQSCPAQCRNFGTDKRNCGGGKPHRLKENVTHATAIMADLDSTTRSEFDAHAERIGQMSYEILWYETFSSAPGVFKGRIVVFFDEPMPIGSPEEWSQHAWGVLLQHLALDGIAVADKSCKDPARLYYLPRQTPGGRKRNTGYTGGKRLDWRSVLGTSSPPVRSAEPKGAAPKPTSGPAKVLTPELKKEVRARLEQYAAKIPASEEWKAKAIRNALAERRPTSLPSVRPAEDQARNPTWLAVTYAVSAVGHELAPDEALLELLKPAWEDEKREAEAAGLGTDVTEWAKIEDMLRRARPKAEKRQAERREAELRNRDSHGEWLQAPGYKVTDNGVFKLGKEERQIAAAPMNVVEIGEDDSGCEYLTLRWPRGDRTKETTRPRGEIYSNELVGLANEGAPVHGGNARGMQEFLQAQEIACQASLPRPHIYSEGWSRDRQAYVFGSKLVGMGATSGRVRLKDDAQRCASQTGGDEAEYRRIALEARDKGVVSEAAWAAGYAAPLIGLLGIRSPVFSLWGESHGGKSALQALAVSPWGRPGAQKLSADMTPAGLNAVLSARNDSLLWVDDTQQARNEQFLENLAYQIGNDTSATRATQTGDARAVRSWRVLVFVSGERPLFKKGAASGAQNRAIEVHDAPLRAEHARGLHIALEKHHGWTGPRFIEQLINRYTSRGDEGIEELCRLYRLMEKTLGQPSGATAIVALLMLANCLARILAFGEAARPAVLAARAMGLNLLKRVQVEQAEVGQQFEARHDFLASWVSENAAGFENGVCPRRLGKYLDPNRTTVAILPTVLDEFGKKYGVNIRQFVAELKEKGFLEVGEGRNDRKKVRLPDGITCRCYCIKLPDLAEPNVARQESLGLESAQPAVHTSVAVAP